jgi:serine/threonine protein kinase
MQNVNSGQKILELQDGIFGIIGIALDIAFGTWAIHLHGFAHCDIKPDNCLVLWTPDHPVIKLADFGTLTMVPADGSLKRYPGSRGTPGYYPEEADRTFYGLKTDVYSLAMVLIDLAQCGYGLPGSLGCGAVSRDRKNNRPPECSDEVNSLWTILEMALMPDANRISLTTLIYDITKFLCNREFSRAKCREVMARMFNKG